MKIKDIIKTVALLLNREKVVKYLDVYGTENCPQTIDTDVLSDVDLFCRCANLCIEELASTYFPMVKEETFSPSNGKIAYSGFNDKVIEVLNVYDDSGNQVNFKADCSFLFVDMGSCIVKYRYLPSIYTLTDEIGYDEKVIDGRIIAYGVASEICLVERAFDQSVIFRKRFIEEIENKLKPKSFVSKGRNFL